jgi:hypothetical protein
MPDELSPDPGRTQLFTGVSRNSTPLASARNVTQFAKMTGSLRY